MLSDFLTWANQWSALLDIAIALLGGWIVWSIKKWIEDIVEKMNKNLETRTAPIQPNANGGKSLPDAITILTSVDTKIDRVHDRVDELHEKVNGVARDFEHLRGRFDQHIESEHDE